MKSRRMAKFLRRLQKGEKGKKSKCMQRTLWLAIDLVGLDTTEAGVEQTVDGVGGSLMGDASPRTDLTGEVG